MKLETERLILRKPRMSDLEDYFEGINNLKILKNLKAVPYPYAKKQAKQWLEKSVKKIKNKYKFVIEIKSEKKVIGLINLKINTHSKKGSTGSWINEKYWNKGYITEAKVAVNEFAFNKLKLRKLETEVYEFNKASNIIQKKVGYSFEGTRKKSVLCKATGKINDVNLYGLLKEDWKKNLPKLKKHLKEKIKKLK